MKISIVTPTFNRHTYLDETIESVLTQKGNFSIEYIVQDGGSGDDVLAILDKWKRRVDAGCIDIRCNDVSFEYYTEKDNGMYDAITKGFRKSSGDLMAWINSDDMYHRAAFQTITQIFEKFQNVFWITGIPNSYNLHGSRTGFDKSPDVYSRKYIEAGYYDVEFLEWGFNWIQQESTIWKRVLWERSGGLDLKLKYAADFHLWQAFARHADLVRVQSFIGGFRVHGDQITANPMAYRGELSKNRHPPHGLQMLNKLFLVSPNSRRKYLADNFQAKQLLANIGLLRDDITGRAIEWNYEINDWTEVWKLIV